MDGIERSEGARLVAEVRTGGMTRRELVRRGAALGLGFPTLAALLAACGDEADTTSATAPAATSEAAPATSAEATTAAESTATSGPEVEVRWRTRPDNQAEIDLYNQVSTDLDGALDGVTLKYEPGNSETSSYQDVLKTEISSGTAPDVFWLPGTDIADFAKRGLIMDFRELADAGGHKDADFYPQIMELLTYNPETKASGEALWGLPRDVSAFALYLNLDLLEEAGVDDPREQAKAGTWNWETFGEAAQKVTDLGGKNKGFGMNSWWANPGYFINAAGGSFFNADRTGCAVDTPEAIAGLEFMKALYNDRKVAVAYGEDAEPPFKAGTVGMFQNGRWATPGMREGVPFKWDVVKLPDGPAGPSNWLFWGAYCINAKSKNPEAAWKLVQGLTTAETQGKISELGANIPSRTSEEAITAFLGYTPPDNNQAFVDGITQNPVAEGPLWEGNWPAFDAALGPKIQDVVTGKTTLEAFKASACRELDQTFKA